MARSSVRNFRPPAVPYEKLRRLPQAKQGTNNARLYITDKNGKKLDSKPLWVYEHTSEFGVSGSTAQSQAKRDFYAHNFNQPTYTFQCQTHNEREYGEIAEFIRNGQMGAIRLDQFFEITMTGSGFRAGRSLRGPSASIHYRGYVQNAQRHHERFIQAPEFTLTFVIVQVKAGLIRDTQVAPNVLPTNWTNFVNRDGTSFVVKPKEIGLEGDEKKPAPKKGKPLPPSNTRRAPGRPNPVTRGPFSPRGPLIN